MRDCPETQRTSVPAGSLWGPVVGYSRAVRVGSLIHVAGTTAAAPGGGLAVHGGPYEQAVYVLQRIEDALHQLGAELGDVVRTRMYVTDIGQWESKSKPMLSWEIAK